jgi:uncharacterized membrane protein
VTAHRHTGHGHGRHSHEGDDILPARTRRVLLLVTVPAFVLTIVGMVLLRPTGTPDVSEAVELPSDLVDGTVVGMTPSVCPGLEGGEPTCRTVRVRLTSGPDSGEIVSFEATDTSVILTLEVGDEIVLSHTGNNADDFAYDFADRQRRVPMAVLALLFAAMVVALGRWRGLAALVGFGISLAVLIQFTLPAILAGRSPLAVAIVSSSAIMFVALYMAHGVSARTTTAVLGTLLSLTITGILALLFVEAARLSGFASEEAIFVKVAAEQLNLQGLLLGGIIIGSLGVLDDVTVTQASAVWELHRANPEMGARSLYRSAIRIGRDHIASTVNTLVLAYAGASLPLLVLFTIAGPGLANVLNGEVVAEEVVRTLVGSIGLVASVPITTALAVLVVGGRHTGAPAVPAPVTSPAPDRDFWEEE